MQLHMTAPLDIGLDLQDATLHYGQDDIFNLQDTEKQLLKKGGIAKLISQPEVIASDSDTDDDVIQEDEDDSDIGSEGDRKVTNLEAELDGMYDAYQERLKEKDTKHRVKEARLKDKSREEWHGFQPKDSDEEESDEEGGWEEMAEAKAQVDQDSDSDDEIEDEALPQRKRKRAEEQVLPRRQQKKVRLEKATSTAKLQTSRAAQVWFDQDIFNEIGSLPSGDEEDVKGLQEHSDDMDQDDQEDSLDEDIEVVPQEPDDEPMWDVDDEDVDAAKQKKIQSKSSNKFYFRP
jgi:AdoMet-dependent rRNA methyltransferase SPB1